MMLLIFAFVVHREKLQMFLMMQFLFSFLRKLFQAFSYSKTLACFMPNEDVLSTRLSITMAICAIESIDL